MGGATVALFAQTGTVEDFNPRSPWGERPSRVPQFTPILGFQSTLPVGGATCLRLTGFWVCGISIHAPRGGSDSDFFDAKPRARIFQSTLPVGGATRVIILLTCSCVFQSTLPVGGATRQTETEPAHHNISIHAPRGGSDFRHSAQMQIRNISIHAPRGGSDPEKSPYIGGREAFQSTLPVGGATLLFLPKYATVSDFNPRSPWGERRASVSTYFSRIAISIHAPRGGSDL